MRWDALFGDLEAQWDAAEAAEFEAEVRERTRIEQARICAADRLRGALGRMVTVGGRGAEPWSGTLVRVGADWLLLATGEAEIVVPLAAVRWVGGLGPAVVRSAQGAGRLRLGHVLRELARGRMPVAVTDVDGGRIHGVVELVGADYLEIADRSGEPRVVPFGAIGAVRSA